MRTTEPRSVLLGYAPHGALADRPTLLALLSLFLSVSSPPPRGHYSARSARPLSRSLYRFFRSDRPLSVRRGRYLRDPVTPSPLHHANIPFRTLRATLFRVRPGLREDPVSRRTARRAAGMIELPHYSPSAVTFGSVTRARRIEAVSSCRRGPLSPNEVNPCVRRLELRCFTFAAERRDGDP